MITADGLRSQLIYNPTTGIFRWADGRRKIGSVTQTRHGNQVRYLVIYIDGHLYGAHRLAWLYMNGEFPTHQIDHINGDGLDNRWCNLREATRSQNTVNSLARKDSKTGVRGVYLVNDRRINSVRKYRVRLAKDGVQKSFGYFDTLEDAIKAQRRAAAELHGEFARVS